VIRGLLLDFYGTVVEEDDEIVASICARAAASGAGAVTAEQMGAAWWKEFHAAMEASAFPSQRENAVASLAMALSATGCAANAAVLCEEQVRYWRTAPLRPGTRAFLDSVDLPICVVSNIDRTDLEAVLGYHGLSFAATVTAGIAAIWVNRAGRPLPDGAGAAAVIGNLADLARRLTYAPAAHGGYWFPA
jgi:2-haloacid dehalogenase